MKRVLPVIALFVVAYIGLGQIDQRKGAMWPTNQAGEILVHAFNKQKSHVQIEGKGVVIKILPDDDEGSRHQRFIVRLDSGQTVLIAHNIDLAPRVSPLKKGDMIMFKGVYEWNSKGGVVHWTHHDPSGRHIAGWLKHGDQIYQ